MKKTVVISFVCMQLFACNKEAKEETEHTEPETEQLSFILAGQTDGDGINYSGEIMDTLLFDYPASGETRFIDLNDDGTADFELVFDGTASPGHQNSNNSIIAIGSSFLSTPDFDQGIVDTLSLNDTINVDLNWVSDTCILYNYYEDDSGALSKVGLWNDVRDKYIGTKILVDNKEILGWIHVEITNGWNLTLMDYACLVED